MLGARLGLAACFRDGIAAFFAAVGRGAGTLVVARQVGLQRGLGEIVEFGTEVYNIHVLVPFLQVEQSIELSEVAPGPFPVGDGMRQDVGGGDPAFQ